MKDFYVVYCCISRNVNSHRARKHKCGDKMMRNSINGILRVTRRADDANYRLEVHLENGGSCRDMSVVAGLKECMKWK